MTLDLLPLVAYTLVGVLIFWRKSSEWVAFSSSLTLITAGVSVVRQSEALFFADPRLRLPLLVFYTLGSAAAIVLVFILPNGRFVPRWTFWLALGAVLHTAVYYLWTPLVAGTLTWPPPPVSPVFLLSLGAGALSQVYRYRRLSSGAQRQQAKWIVLGLAICATGVIVFRMGAPYVWPEVGEPGLGQMIYRIVGVPLVYACLMLPPLTIGVSVMVHRLWDIDMLVSRSLVYGSLTAVLAGLYVASVTLFQKLFVLASGQQTDAAAVLSTFLIVSLSSPIKDRLQSLIDKRRAEAPSGARKLEALSRQVQARLSPVYPLQATQRLLRDAVAEFDAKGGAVYWQPAGVAAPIHTLGDWDGHPQATVELVGADGARPLGALALAERRSGLAYTDDDLALLRQTGSIVADAIEEDSAAFVEPAGAANVAAVQHGA